MAVFGHFDHFLAILAKIPGFCEGFYINPSRRGPAVPQKGVLAGVPQKARKRAILGHFPQNGEKGRF